MWTCARSPIEQARSSGIGSACGCGRRYCIKLRTVAKTLQYENSYEALMFLREQNLNVLANWENWDLTRRVESGNILVYGKRPTGSLPCGTAKHSGMEIRRRQVELTRNSNGPVAKPDFLLGIKSITNRKECVEEKGTEVEKATDAAKRLSGPFCLGVFLPFLGQEGVGFHEPIRLRKSGELAGSTCCA